MDNRRAKRFLSSFDPGYHKTITLGKRVAHLKTAKSNTQAGGKVCVGRVFYFLTTSEREVNGKQSSLLFCMGGSNKKYLEV